MLDQKFGNKRILNTLFFLFTSIALQLKIENNIQEARHGNELSDFNQTYYRGLWNILLHASPTERFFKASSLYMRNTDEFYRYQNVRVYYLNIRIISWD